MRKAERAQQRIVVQRFMVKIFVREEYECGVVAGLSESSRSVVTWVNTTVVFAVAKMAKNYVALVHSSAKYGSIFWIDVDENVRGKILEFRSLSVPTML